jgi:hypothetical protein
MSAGTERAIAGAFLVLDEADSLLLERADAVRSWEISEVNGMLTWMEQHPQQRSGCAWRSGRYSVISHGTRRCG